jgi:hypothetical protein
METCPKCGAVIFSPGQFRCNSLLLEDGNIIQSITCTYRQIAALTTQLETQGRELEVAAKLLLQIPHFLDDSLEELDEEIVTWLNRYNKAKKVKEAGDGR